MAFRASRKGRRRRYLHRPFPHARGVGNQPTNWPWAQSWGPSLTERKGIMSIKHATVNELGQFCSAMISDIDAGRADLRKSSKILQEVTARVREVREAKAAKGKDPRAVA